jgi:hypothetical protein
MVEKPRSARVQTPPRKKTPDANGQVTHAVYGPEIVEKICTLLAEGHSWRSICNTDGLPAYTTLYAWIARYPEFAKLVAAARRQGADACADRALEVAEQATQATIQRDRLLVGTLMKRAALTAPRRWGGRAKQKKPAKPEPVEMIFSVRHFERVVGDDGHAFVRELKEEGEA